MGQVNAAMVNAKCKDNSEENNEDLDDHSNQYGIKWEVNGFLELDDKHNLLMEKEART